MITQSINKMIDHTLLKPEATAADIAKLCQEAIVHAFHSVCIHPGWLDVARSRLAGSEVVLCTVVGFPSGATSSEVKAFETKWAVKQGAREIDMVLAIGRLRSGDDDFVLRDITSVVKAASPHAVKVILETHLLSPEQQIRAARMAQSAGAHFVKTSTGFGGGGATVDDVRRLRSTVGPGMGVKASGGIRDRATALQMIAAGADRLGTSAGVAIVEQTPGVGQDVY